MLLQKIFLFRNLESFKTEREFHQWYRKSSLKLHPDKNPNNQNTFQMLASAFKFAKEHCFMGRSDELTISRAIARYMMFLKAAEKNDGILKMEL